MKDSFKNKRLNDADMEKVTGGEGLDGFEVVLEPGLETPWGENCPKSPRSDKRHFSESPHDPCRYCNKTVVDLTFEAANTLNNEFSTVYIDINGAGNLTQH
ncbi:MAG: hypothetical protein J5372_08560 [Lachnospiraceae bacterium]|nr:hypothetical protein [Lachnospiraceae bacterium]